MQRSITHRRVGAVVPNLLSIGACLVLLAGCRGYDPLATASGSDLGALVVSSVSTGGAFDVDGFEVRVDGSGVGVIDVGNPLELWVPLGIHTVELGGVADNCSVAGESPRDVAVENDFPTSLEFEVVCDPPARLASIRFAFARSKEGAEGSAIVALNADGSEQIALTSGEFNDYGPVVSPDGKQVAFLRGGDLYVMGPDGIDPTLLTSDAYDPAWSPDGRRIAFTAFVDDAEWGGSVRVVDVDGSGVQGLTFAEPYAAEDAMPAWSPDGMRIAFVRYAWPPDWVYGTEASIGIWVMDSDGADPSPVRSGGPFGPTDPVWSPDATRIGFVDTYPDDTSRIVAMNADGSSVTELWKGRKRERVALDDWSSDGQRMLFTKWPQAGRGHDVYLLEVAAGTVVRLTADGRSGGSTFWPSSVP